MPILLAAAAWLATADAERVAILPLQVDGLAVNDVRRIDGVVRGRVASRAGVEVVPEETTNALVDSSQASNVACALAEAACAVELGRIADVDTVLVGSARHTLDGVVVDLRLIDVKTGAVKARALGLVAAEPKPQVLALQELMRGLHGEGPLGALVLDVTPPVAHVTLDGQPVGATRIAALLPGEHVVVAEAAGFVGARTRVVVGGAGDTPLALHLAAIPPPPPPSFLEVAAPWLVGGSGGLLALGGGALVVVGAQPYGEYAAADADLRALPVDEPAYPADAAALQGKLSTAAQRWNDSGRYAVGVGAAVASVGLVAVALGVVWPFGGATDAE